MRVKVPDLSEPSSALRDGRDQMRVGSRRPFPVVGDDELHLHAAPLEPDREIEPAFVFALRICHPISTIRLAIAEHLPQGLSAKSDADALVTDFDANHHVEQEAPLVGRSGFEDSVAQAGCLGKLSFHAPTGQAQGFGQAEPVAQE